MDWERLCDEVRAIATRVGDNLRALPPGDLRLSRVTWSAAEVGAHLVGLPPLYRSMIAGPRPVPDSLAADNWRRLAEVTERDPATLADRLETEVAGLLDALGDDGGRRVWYFTVEHTAAGIGGIMLTELLIHGWDLADRLGRPWPITRPQAVACLRGLLPAIVVVVDPAAAATATGTYHIAVRGGGDWTYTVRDGRVTVEPVRPPRADLHLSADPVTFLRNAYGLVSNARAALSGGIVAWGRRPWLAGRFAKLFAET